MYLRLIGRRQYRLDTDMDERQLINQEAREGQEVLKEARRKDEGYVRGSHDHAADPSQPLMSS